jgi:hypothetical protein
MKFEDPAKQAKQAYETETSGKPEERAFFGRQQSQKDVL